MVPTGGVPLLTAGALELDALGLDALGLGSLDGVEEATSLVGRALIIGIVGVPGALELTVGTIEAGTAGLLEATPAVVAAVVGADTDMLGAVSSPSLSSNDRDVVAEQADPTKPAVARQASVRWVRRESGASGVAVFTVAGPWK